MVRNHGEEPFIKKNGNITDFFKPFARASSPLKRPIPEGTTRNSHGEQPPPSKSQKLSAGTSHRHSSEPSSSRLSALTPIASEDSIELPADTLLNPPRASNSAHSTSSSFGLSTTPSSQRVLKNGQTVILNSDNESDSDSSLADIDEILRPQRRARLSSPLTELGSSDPELPSPTQLPTMTRLRSSRRLRQNARKDASIEKRYEFSLHQLLERTEKDNAEDEAYRRALNLADEIVTQQMPSESKYDTPEPSAPLSAEKLASKLHIEDSDDVDKLMQALKRTEALQTNSSWSFFKDSQAMPQVQVPPLPLPAKPPWAFWEQQPAHQEIGFLSGSVADVAAAGNLPGEVLKWILEYAYFEPREDLYLSYLLVVEKAGPQAEEILDKAHLTNLMFRLGMSREAGDPSRKIDPKKNRVHGSPQRGTRDRALKNFLLMAGRIAPFIRCRVHLLYILLCMSFDSSIVSEANLLFALQDAIASCVESEPNESFLVEAVISDGIFVKTDDLHLQLQLIRTIPCLSAACCNFRRRLALAFFFGEKSYLAKPTSPLPRLSEVGNLLRSSRYNVTRGADFHQLGAQMSLLDIGIDDGDRPNESLDAEAEKKFNLEVDELYKAIAEKSSRIVDSGASHMSRTEAKEVMLAFEARLQYAVRTKPRPKKSIYGNIDSAESKNFMKNHFKAKKPE